MNYVHVFIGMDASVDPSQLRTYLRATYSEDGDRLNSVFLNEVGIADYEPQAIESAAVGESGPLRKILAGSSYLALWQAGLPDIAARYFVLLFAPNVITRTNTTLVHYIGKFDFTIPRAANP